MPNRSMSTRNATAKSFPAVSVRTRFQSTRSRTARAAGNSAAKYAMGAVSHRFVAAISGTPGATWMAATGREQPGTAAYGIALLSRFHVRSWQVVRLPRIPTTFPMYLREPNTVTMVKEEPRAAMVARLDTPLGAMTVANTQNLSFVPGGTACSCHLVRDLHGFDGPRVLMGDLNMTPAKVSRRFGLRPLGVAPTFPTDDPHRQLDHILTDDAALHADGCDAPILPISDHRALVVDVSRP
jgi:endonuclease/exonuclease/phosphatase family metal-dependent hydrolase